MQEFFEFVAEEYSEDKFYRVGQDEGQHARGEGRCKTDVPPRAVRKGDEPQRSEKIDRREADDEADDFTDGRFACEFAEQERARRHEQKTRYVTARGAEQRGQTCTERGEHGHARNAEQNVGKN